MSDSNVSPHVTNRASITKSKRKGRSMRCQYCSDIFHRIEHLERHERTHTKEKPFSCGCGKAFSRRDLLIRHTRLVHRNGPNNDDSVMTENSSSAPRIAPMHGGHIQFDQNASETLSTIEATPRSTLRQLPETMFENRDLGTLSTIQFQSFPEGMRQDHGATQQSGPIYEYQSSRAQNAQALDVQMNNMLYNNIADRPITSNGANGIAGTSSTPQEYNLFLDDYHIHNFYLPAALFDSDLPTSLWSQPEWNDPLGLQNHLGNNEPTQRDTDPLSRFGSRLPSLQPEEQNPEPETVPQAYSRPSEPPWKISGQDYRGIQQQVAEFQSVLPEDFILPSRHALSRFLEGYISGFHRHLPFLHIPTFAVTRCVPELLLAICAVGARYRFEFSIGNHLWYAARTVAMEQNRKRNSKSIAALKSPAPFRSSSSHQSPTPGRWSLNSRNDQPLDAGSPQIGDLRLPIAQARLGTIQAFLILMAMGMWGPKALLHEAILLQNQLALLLRERERSLLSSEVYNSKWEDWICSESDCRTKCIAYCFFNLHSIAYDTPPIMLTSEMRIDLPQSAEIWGATTAVEWQVMQEKSPPTPVSFQSALNSLFAAPTHEEQQPISSLGNYALIQAIIQQIYLARQASRTGALLTGTSNLGSEEIGMFERALKMWQIGWERTPESSLDPVNPYGPVAFSSTALLRLAYIRLHCDLGPHRGLDTREPQVIAGALEAAPKVVRGPHVSRAVIHAAHALSIPVKIGINYVAHTQTLLWSMQHALVNLECAYLLSKWLQTIADFLPELTSDEQSLLQMVRSIVNETQFAVSFRNVEVSESVKVRQLGVAVVRLWAETFSGSHHVFPLVRIIGEALDIYANFREVAISV